MKEKKCFLKSPAMAVILLLANAVGAVLYFAARSNWVFLDITFGVEAFTFGVLYAMVINAVILAVFAAIGVYGCEKITDKKWFRVLVCISEVFASLFFIIGVVFVFRMMGTESAGTYFIALKKSLPDAALFIFVPLLALFFPKFCCKTKIAVSCISLVLVAVIGVAQFIPVAPYKITSNPTVIDTGSDYSVIFSTSDCGTGYVEYTYKGTSYKVYDEDGGRLNSHSRIHSINVPYEHLENNEYKVGSVRVFEQYSYGSHTGKEVVSGNYKFTPVKGDDITYLVVSDWHTRLKTAYAAIEYVGDYDAVILMGDATPGVDYEEEVVKNIVEFAGKVSEGSKPVLYTRGNHETRGEYANKLADALGLDKFYYTADMGNYSFIVLDSGEDKDDSHAEYGGMTDYNTYRADMIEWLKGVNVNNDKVIALSHSYKISDVEKDLSDAGWNEIDRLGARLMISGHTHHCRLIGGNGEREQEIFSQHPGIVGYMDGGKSGENYVASKMILSKENVVLEAYNNLGEKVFEHSIKW